MGEFEQMLVNNLPIVRGIITRHLSGHGRQDIDDVVQEVCIAMFVAYQKDQKKVAATETNFTRYIIGITNNKWKDYYRRAYCLRKHEVYAPVKMSVAADTDSDFVNNIENRLLVEQAIEVLNKRNPMYAEVLRYRYLSDLTEEQIAQLMGIPKGTVKSRLHYIRKYLAEWLA